MKNFMLPGLYEKFPLNKAFIEFYFNNKHMFYDDINIYCTYGSFPFSIWDGGRIFLQYQQASKESIEEIKAFNDFYNIKTRLVCTNPILEEQHLFDDFMNLVLELCYDNQSEIVINSDLLKNYILQNYPNYSLISSTTKRITNKEDLIKELENPDYKMICLDYDFNNNFKILNSIPNNLKNKCEFLVNAICPPGCPTRKKHYDLNGAHMLSYGKQYSITCGIKKVSLDPENEKRKSIITTEQIEKKYLPNGFENFKIEGRTFSNEVLLGHYVKYLVKPEYQIFVFAALAEMDIPDYNKNWK